MTKQSNKDSKKIEKAKAKNLTKEKAPPENEEPDPDNNKAVNDEQSESGTADGGTADDGTLENGAQSGSKKSRKRKHKNGDALETEGDVVTDTAKSGVKKARRRTRGSKPHYVKVPVSEFFSAVHVKDGEVSFNPGRLRKLIDQAEAKARKNPAKAKGNAAQDQAGASSANVNQLAKILADFTSALAGMRISGDTVPPKQKKPKKDTPAGGSA